MYLNKNTTPTSIIKKAKPMSLPNKDVGKSWFLQSSEAERNANGIFTITEDLIPSRRYYTCESVLNEDTAHITRTPVNRDVADVQALMYKDLEATANTQFNDATEGYTPAEMSSWNELEAEAIAHQTTALTSGMLYDEAVFAGITVGELATKVLANAAVLKQYKSYISGTRKKVALEIVALTDVNECILYERTPYDYTLTEEDVIDGNGTVGDIVVRHKNNVSDWS